MSPCVHTPGDASPEVHPHARRQPPEPFLDHMSSCQHVIDQLEGRVLGQLAQMAGREHSVRDLDGTAEHSGGTLT